VAQLGQTINMASAAFGSGKTYQPSVNGPETMVAPEFKPSEAPSGRYGYGGAVIFL
jgi:hypothetical protein